jgi:hypothetical protein
MRVRVQSNVPDGWVIGAVVVTAAAIVLAISILRLGTADLRPASPIDAPTALPTTQPAVNATAVPITSADVVAPAASPARTFVPLESALPNESAIPAKKTPDLPPPGYRLDDQD